MKYKLSEIAKVLISNVDKKSFDNEIPITLCNFTDVYYNWRITPEKMSEFMTATATKSEIDKFLIQDYDVAITKDSETRDDIGVSTYFEGIFTNLVLGYHCALIRPNSSLLDGGYLNALLNTNYGKKYFSHNAGGSGQRFTLSLESIKNMKIELPIVSYQRLITNILGTLDKKIELNRKKIKILENIADLIFMQYFFYKIPNGVIGDLIVEQPKSKIQVNKVKDEPGVYPFFTSGKAILEYKNYLIDGKNIFLNTGGTADVKIYFGKAAYSTDTWCLKTKEGYTVYIYLFLKMIIREINLKFFQGSGLKHLQKDMILTKKVYIPLEDEILCIGKYLESIYYKISKMEKENNIIKKQRDFLLPLLINGQVIVK